MKDYELEVHYPQARQILLRTPWVARPIFRDEIIASEKNDEGMVHIKRRMQEGGLKVACFHEDAEGTLWFKERFVVPKKEALKKILDEAHTSRYFIHPESTKMYHNLR
jgi:hypothetical protein